MSRRVWAGFAGWLAAVVLATVAGVAAVTVAGADLTGSSARPLSEDEVWAALATPTPPGENGGPAGTESSPMPADTAIGPSPRSSDAGVAKVFTSPGGTVLARCVGGQVSLEWWTPQQGYQVDDVRRGPGREVKVEFESAAGEVELRIICQGGVPRLRVDDD